MAGIWVVGSGAFHRLSGLEFRGMPARRDARIVGLWVAVKVGSRGAQCPMPSIPFFCAKTCRTKNCIALPAAPVLSFSPNQNRSFVHFYHTPAPWVFCSPVPLSRRMKNDQRFVFAPDRCLHRAAPLTWSLYGIA